MKFLASSNSQRSKRTWVMNNGFSRRRKFSYYNLLIIMNSIQKYSTIAWIWWLVSKFIIAYFVAKIIPWFCSSESCGTPNYFSGLEITFMILAPRVILDIILILWGNNKNKFLLFWVLFLDIFSIIAFFSIFFHFIIRSFI